MIRNERLKKLVFLAIVSLSLTGIVLGLVAFPAHSAFRQAIATTSLLVLMAFFLKDDRSRSKSVWLGLVLAALIISAAESVVISLNSTLGHEALEVSISPWVRPTAFLLLAALIIALDSVYQRRRTIQRAAKE